MKFLFALLVWALATCAHAVDLTPAQTAALKSAIIADANLAPQKATRDTQAIADYLNTASAFVVWKTTVSVDEVMRSGMDWTQVDNLSAGKARIWDWMSRLGSFDCSKPTIRAGIDATWVGTSAALAVRALVYTQCKRPSTWFEKVFATGTGTDATPGLLVIEAPIDELTIRRLAWSDAGDWLL
ncbi:hypothetical protein [Accumulibacter sp.]|uniref:hypothetical protein n=1 Tax=Accumulibacter sp. TaxID=2053492 RepID=UPI00263879A1|nr:hypothetical protein [Accumulibacter sp.]